MRRDGQSLTAVMVSSSVKNMAQQDGYRQLLAQMESLADGSAESTLATLAAAIFPNGFGTLHQVSWEGNGAGQIDPPLALGAEATAEQRTSDRLRAAELRYRTLIEQIPAVTFMAVLGEGQNEIYVSPHIEALLGFTQKEWLENPFLWFTQLYPDDQSLLYEEFARGCRTGGPFHAECRLIARDGRIVWVRGEARLIKDELGRPLFLQGVAFDITESKQAEAVLLREAVTTTEQRYRNLVEQLGAIFWEAEVDKPGFTFVSRGAEQILGFSSDRWIAEPDFWLSRVHPDDKAGALEAWTHARSRSGGTAEFEFRAITAKGETLWLHEKAYVYQPPAGEPRLIGTIFDITARKEAEEILRLSAARLETETRIGRTLHRIGSELASELTLERVVQLATDEATALTGAQFGAFFYNVVDEQGEAYTLYALSGVPREAFAKFPMPRNTAIFGPTFNGTAIVRLDDVTKDPRYGKNAPHYGMPKGHLPVHSYLAVPVTSRSGEVLGGMFFGHATVGKFTQEHQDLAAGIAGWTALAIDNARLYSAAESARQSAEKAKQAAESANRAKDEFLATMSHELRTPLNAVLGWIQILRSGAGTASNRDRALATIERNARAQAQIIDDLLDVSRIVTGKLALNIGPVDIVSVVEAALEAIQLPVSAKPLTLRKQIADVPAPVSGDADRLRQVFTNLLTNAVKFTPAGGRIDVTVAVQQGRVQVRVADSGQGIEPEFLTHVFDRFWQRDSSTARVHGGLGLGLAIVRHLVEMHGGAVSAESPGVGLGAAFTVELPLSVQIGQPQPNPSDDRRPTVTGGLQDAYIVVIDDEEDSRDLIVNILAPTGAQVVSASNVAEGLRAVYERAPDLIICDLGMPYADGFEMVRQLRLMGEPHASTPAIALTAYARDEDRKRALAAGFQEHVGKPFDVKVLVQTAARLIATKRGG
jgi:PAS domain S-box-containing protein